MPATTQFRTGPLAVAWLLGSLSCGLLGCQHAPSRGAADGLPSDAAVTLTTAEEITVFARTEGRYSRSARDYVYLGPVQTNRAGRRDYYLWVGVATTLDRGYLVADTTLPDMLLVVVQGEPIEFELRPWLELEPALAHATVYRTTLDTQAQLGARVTLDQLRLLGQAPFETIRLGKASGSLRAYEAWHAPVRWSGAFETED
jgi:hypothetical protein